MIPLKKATVPTRRAFAQRMAERGGTDGRFAVFESDIGYSTYSNMFGNAFPDRYFNMGIAEANTIAAAAGMAAAGRPVVACGYGVFITMRALEAVRSFICYPNLNVKFLSSHGGVTAAIDGVTHQATEDIGIMGTLPNMKILVPSDTVAAGKMFDVALDAPGPVFTRLMRDPLYDLYGPEEEFVMGGSKVVRRGTDITIAVYGDMVFQALEAAQALKEEGILAEVLDMYSVKPFDRKGLEKSIDKTGALLVAENHQKSNGLGYGLAHYCMRTRPVAFDSIGLEDTFAESGDYRKMLDKYGLSAQHIIYRARQVVKKKTDGNGRM